jgi:hypothetical protein
MEGDDKGPGGESGSITGASGRDAFGGEATGPLHVWTLCSKWEGVQTRRRSLHKLGLPGTDTLHLG